MKWSTNHTDAPVIPVNQLLVVWSSVNRISKNGTPIGLDECITPYQALQSVTINSAYEIFEENTKFSQR